MSTIGPISFSMTVPQHDDDAVHEAPMRFLEGTPRRNPRPSPTWKSSDTYYKRLSVQTVEIPGPHSQGDDPKHVAGLRWPGITRRNRRA
jgi:hypothetical protein